MNAGLFDVFHDRADHARLAVGDAIDIDFHRVFQKPIHQDRPIRADLDRALHVTAQIVAVINQLHRPAAQNERGPDQHRVTNPLRDRDRFIGAHRRTTRRLAEAELVEHGREQLPVFRHLDAFRLRADDRNAGFFQSLREIQRRLPAELHDDAFGKLLLVDIEHVFERERLEIKFVARVVIGRNRFRVRVDHDRFEPDLPQRERGVDAAIIELDPLPDPVRPAAENHDLRPLGPAHLVLGPVGGIIVRRERLKLRRASIDKPVSGNNARPPCASARTSDSETPLATASWRSENPSFFRRRNSGGQARSRHLALRPAGFQPAALQVSAPRCKTCPRSPADKLIRPQPRLLRISRQCNCDTLQAHPNRAQYVSIVFRHPERPIAIEQFC